ncbi:MAG: hypothetical protein ACXV5I_08980 [Halobacteriota archaeon]
MEAAMDFLMGSLMRYFLANSSTQRSIQETAVIAMSTLRREIAAPAEKATIDD